jgi:6-phosphofructokinase 1
VRLIVERKFGHMVTYQPPDMKDVPIIEAIQLAQVCPNCSAVQAARALGICFGDDYQDPPFKFESPASAAHAGSNGHARPKAGKRKPVPKSSRS